MDANWARRRGSGHTEVASGPLLDFGDESARKRNTNPFLCGIYIPIKDGELGE